MHWYPNSLAQDCSIPRIAIIMLMHCPELNHRCACLLYLNKNFDTDWLILTNSLIDLMGSVDYYSTDHQELTEHLTINGWCVGRSRILLFLQYCHWYVFQCFLWLLHSWSSFPLQLLADIKPEICLWPWAEGDAGSSRDAVVNAKWYAAIFLTCLSNI